MLQEVDTKEGAERYAKEQAGNENGQGVFIFDVLLNHHKMHSQKAAIGPFQSYNVPKPMPSPVCISNHQCPHFPPTHCLFPSFSLSFWMPWFAIQILRRYRVCSFAYFQQVVPIQCGYFQPSSS